MAENRFGAISAEEEDEAPAAPRFGAISAEEEEPAAPASAAQASISEAFNKPAAGQRGMLSKAAEAGLFGLADIGSGAVAGAPLGLGPSVLGMLPGTSAEEVKKDIAAAKARSPVLFGVGEFGSELATTFLPGAAAGEFLATKAAPALTRAFPVLSKAPGVLEAALKGIGLGTVTGGEEAGRAVVEGAPVGEALKAGAETGGSMMLMPLGFQAAPAVAKVAPQVVRAGIEKVPSYLRNLVPEVVSSPAAATGRAVEATSRFLAPAVAPVGLAYESMPSKGASASEWTKWALNQGILAGGVAGEGFEKLAAKSKADIQPALRRATSEGMEMARGNIYEQEARKQVQERALEEPVAKMRREQAVRTQAESEISTYTQAEANRRRSIQDEAEARQEATRQAGLDRQIVEEARKGDYRLRDAETKKRNQQFRMALRQEGRILRNAENLQTRATETLARLQSEAENLAALERGIEDGSDPSLRGMLGKLFQDTNNRIKGAEEAVARNPGRYAPEFVQQLQKTRDIVDDSYIRNTDRGGYLSDFVDDPYARLEAYRRDRMTKVSRDRDANAAAQAQAAERLLADFVQEARAQQKPVQIPEERIREIAEQAGLAYERREGVAPGQIDPLFGTQETYPLIAAPASAVAPESRVVALERRRAEKPVTKAQMVEIVRREREARGERAPTEPTSAQARLRQLRQEEAEARLGTATGETPLQIVVRRLRELPEGDPRKAELESRVQAEFERQVAAGGRVNQGLAAEAEYGEKPPLFNPMKPTRIGAASKVQLPDWVQPTVLARAITGPVRASIKAPESKFKETQAVREERRPTESAMEKPFSAVAMLRAWDKVLERPSEKTMGALARVADRMGITYDKLLKTTAYRAAALEQALKDPEVAKEVMANVNAP